MLERSYYVETSVWGMVAKGQPRKLRSDTLRFLKLAPSQEFYISPVVLREVADCKNPARMEITRAIRLAAPKMLEENDDCKHLAQFYLDSEILPAKKIEDALHVALATVHQMEVLVSWNHRHMANARKTAQYRAANLLRGYRTTPHILTPYEVVHEEGKNVGRSAR